MARQPATPAETELLGQLLSALSEIEALWDTLNTVTGNATWTRASENGDVARIRSTLASYGCTVEG